MADASITKKKFGDWFDAENMNHLAAYKHLQKTGTWPKGFIPENVEMEAQWLIHVIDKIANQWIKEKLGV